MRRLIYVSRSVNPFPRNFKSLLLASQRNNHRLGITGALFFLNGVYCQYLEGEVGILENLYRKIAANPQHKDIKIVDFGRINSRLFPNWSMALLTWNLQTRALFKASNAADSCDLYALTTASAAVTFRAFSQSSNWLELSPPTNSPDLAPARAAQKAA